MSKLPWYWHRLRAMEPAEIAANLRRKLFQWSDEQELPDWSSATLRTDERPAFPRLPPADSAPLVLRQALQRDLRDILAGRWRAFGHLPIDVDDPPRWHKDYYAGQDLATDEFAFKLNHRQLPEGADIKLIWELSRWYQLVRLAMAAYVLKDGPAARKCVAWLADWAGRNPPYQGWNWTSALEAGMRLVQFTWIDALLDAQVEAGGHKTESDRLRREILPAHVRYAWRYRSFGSSANNHLLGELTGLILAVVRWPDLARWAVPLDRLQKLWEQEVLAQFAGDGGNREQALNYHLFSWEFCRQAQAALRETGRRISTEVEERVHRAEDFFLNMQVETDAWDYGDSDNGLVTPFFLKEQTAAAEWRDWFRYPESSPALHYWLGPRARPAWQSGNSRFVPPTAGAGLQGGWQIYSESGLAVSRSENWTLRWDLSPLGYLSTAAHGHLDALHVSIWFRGVALVIDPGTGAYYGNKKLRTFLASWEAHNGPHPAGLDFPRRLGPFLWSAHHGEPNLKPGPDTRLSGELSLPAGLVKRTLVPLSREEGWQVDDSFHPRAAAGDYEFGVRWQFAPNAKLEKLAQRKFRVTRENVSIEIEVSADWTEVCPVDERNNPAPSNAPGRAAQYAGTVSPAFRKTEWAPFLKLTARGHKPCVFRTAFLTCRNS